MFQEIKTLEDLLEHDKRSKDIYTLDEICEVKIKDFTKFIPTIYPSLDESQEINLIDQNKFNETIGKFAKKVLSIENIVIVGGFVASQFSSENKFNDIDFAIYGINNKEQFWKKVIEIITIVRYVILEKDPNNISISFFGEPGIITIASCIGEDIKETYKIILRMYSSISDILHSIDLESSAVVYDGKTTYFSGISAISYLLGGFNIVDLSKRSLFYEDRLTKYLKRGFRIILPHLNIEAIQKIINDRIFRLPFFDFPLKYEKEFEVWKLYKYSDNVDEQYGGRYDEYFHLGGHYLINITDRIKEGKSGGFIFEDDYSKFISFIEGKTNYEDFFRTHFLDFLLSAKHKCLCGDYVRFETLESIFLMNNEEKTKTICEFLQSPPCYDFIDSRIQEIVSKIKPFSLDEWFHNSFEPRKQISEIDWYEKYYVEKINYKFILSSSLIKETCKLCFMEDMKINFVRLNCGHYFHYRTAICPGLFCIDKKICPTCKKPIDKSIY